MRWRLLDEILEIKKGSSAVCKASLPESEYSAEVLLLEMMAQTAGLLLGAESNFEQDIVFAKIQDAVFDLNAADQTFTIEAVCDDPRPDGAWIEAKAVCGSKTAASANILLMNVGHIVEGSTKPVSFHQNFMEYYDVRSKLVEAV